MSTIDWLILIGATCCTVGAIGSVISGIYQCKRCMRNRP